MSHTVTITRLPDEESDDYEYTFGGTHGHDCTVLKRCARKSCQAMSPYYDTERVRHGKQHEWRDGEWLVESDDCGVRFVFELRGDIETFDEAEVSLGTYPVLVVWEDGWFLEVQNPQAEQGEAENR